MAVACSKCFDRRGRRRSARRDRTDRLVDRAGPKAREKRLRAGMRALRDGERLSRAEYLRSEIITPRAGARDKSGENPARERAAIGRSSLFLCG